MNRKPTILRHWLATLLAAVIIAAVVPATAWAQNQGVRVKTAATETTTNVKAVASQDKDGATTTSPTGGNPATTATAPENGTVADATIITAGSGKTVTVTTDGPRLNPTTGKMQVAKVIVTKKEDFLAENITITAAGDAEEMNGKATLQMTANFSPTYTDNKTVVWSVESAPESSATATIDENGLLTAGTTQGDVIITATTQDGSNLQASKTITITTIPLTESMIQNIAAQTYTGSLLQPAVTVKDGSIDLVQDQDFTVTYGDTPEGTHDNINVTSGGIVIVTGAGAYSGSVSKTFSINKANQTPSISVNRNTTSPGLTIVFTITGGNYNSNGNFVIKRYLNGNVTTISCTKNGNIITANGSNSTWGGPSYKYRLHISGNSNWNDYSSGEY